MGWSGPGWVGVTWPGVGWVKGLVWWGGVGPCGVLGNLVGWGWSVFGGMECCGLAWSGVLWCPRNNTTNMEDVCSNDKRHHKPMQPIGKAKSKSAWIQGRGKRLQDQPIGYVQEKQNQLTGVTWRRKDQPSGMKVAMTEPAHRSEIPMARRAHRCDAGDGRRNDTTNQCSQPL